MIANANIDISSSDTRSTAAPRAVTITTGAAKDGRLPIRVKVVPLADLDAKGGVFIDMRTGGRASESADGSASLSIARGDAAIDSLAALEAGEQPRSSSNDSEPARRSEKEPKRPIVSHQIARPKKLIVGQEESFNAEVAVPVAAPDGQAWFVRARFSTQGGKDLCSAWAAI